MCSMTMYQEQKKDNSYTFDTQTQRRLNVTDYELIRKALAIAKEAHAGQVDKAGVDYIYHPITVALLCTSAQEKAVALLHDTLEDCPDKVTYDSLVAEVGRDVADAVKLLTNDGNRGTYLEYVQSIKDSGNKLAIAVKRADLTMNMDLSRIENPSEMDYLRVEEKYKPALEIIEG